MCQGQKGLQKLNDFLTHVSAPPAGKGGAVSAFEGTGRTVARICSGVTAAGRAVGTLLQDAQCGISVLVHARGARKQAPKGGETRRLAVINTIIAATFSPNARWIPQPVHTHGVRKQAPFSQETGRPAVINTIIAATRGSTSGINLDPANNEEWATIWHVPRTSRCFAAQFDQGGEPMFERQWC
jgi:hypothetical protein